ncbi:MAG TPA: SpoIIIAH-like family protein [Symbiobacteriaceae bacterium]|nr:SpoIIIAH-like family protein [Symbiobacteriaceae bacterium]
MIIVRRKGEILRMGLFLLLMGAMAYFILSKSSSFATSQESAGPAPASATPVEPFMPQVTDGRDFYAETRLARDQDRSLRQEQLTAMVNNGNVDAAVRKSAAEELQTAMKYASLENQAEALVRGQGVDDVLVKLTDNQAMVYVKAKDASHQQAVQVADAVATVTGLKLSAVKVRFQE